MSEAGRARILPRRAVTTRDGVELIADVFLPATPAPHPAVLLRTPYGRTAPYLLRLASRLGREGLAVVLQDCRGRNGSGGEAEWNCEDRDARDTVAWLAEQPWFSGHLGLLGVSITSLSAFRLAADKLPAGVELLALANVAGSADPRALFHRAGALVLHWALPWMRLMSRRETSCGLPTEESWERAYRHLPLVEIEPRGGLVSEHWRRIVAGGGSEEIFGAACDLQTPETSVPMLHVAGWYDFLLAPTLAAYRQSVVANHSAVTLVVGPWDHQSLFSGELLEALAAWFGRWLTAGPPRTAPPAVYLRLAETEGWRAFDRFPPEGAQAVDLYLTSRGRAGASCRDGRLVAAPPEEVGSDRYTYDPADPVPTVGGAIWPFAVAGLRPGFADVSAIGGREDVLVYTADPLDRDLVLAGPVTVDLVVATSAPATDFTAWLVDVDPAGTPRLVQDGILRLPPADRDASRPATRRLIIDLAAAGHRFERGHRLRLQVSSSNFPKYDRHLNGVGVPALGAAGARAEQTIFHGGARLSRLRLTVLADGACGRPVELAGALGGLRAAGEASGRPRG